MREYLNYNYKKVYAEQSRIHHIRYILKTFQNMNNVSKNDIISKCLLSSHFNSKMTVDKTIRMMNYYGLLEKKNNLYSLSEFGELAKYSSQNKDEQVLSEVLNYSSYINNYTYHLIIDLLFNISEKELSGSSNFFSQLSTEEQYVYIQNRIEESLEKKLHKPYIRYFTHFIRKMGIIDKSGFIPKQRTSIWIAILLLSISDVLKDDIQSNKEIFLTDNIIREIRAPLFLTKSSIFVHLNMEVLHPFFTINKAKGNEIYIQIKEEFNPKTIIKYKL